MDWYFRGTDGTTYPSAEPRRSTPSPPRRPSRSTTQCSGIRAIDGETPLGTGTTRREVPESCQRRPPSLCVAANIRASLAAGEWQRQLGDRQLDLVLAPLVPLLEELLATRWCWRSWHSHGSRRVPLRWDQFFGGRTELSPGSIAFSQATSSSVLLQRCVARHLNQPLTRHLLLPRSATLFSQISLIRECAVLEVDMPTDLSTLLRLSGHTHAQIMLTDRL